MFNLILFIICSISIINIIQNESIFNKIRLYLYNNYTNFYNYIKCPTCAGFAIGVILSFFIPIFGGLLLNMFIGGLVSSIFNKIFYILIPEKFGFI